MARFFIEKVTSDEDNILYYLKPTHSSYSTLKDDHNIDIYRLVVIPKNNKYLDIYDNQV